MTTQPLDVSVTEPVGQALDRTKKVLFQPFDLGKWFVIGFSAWLALLGEGGGFGSGFNYGGHDGRGWHGLRRGLEEARDYVIQNLYWIAPLVVAMVLVGLAIWLVVTWVSSRGQFMFLHCVALDVAEVQVPWTRFAREANSLFLFRLVIGLIGMVVFLPLVIGLMLAILGMISHEAVRVGGVLLAVGMGLGMVLAGIAFWIVGRLLTDFVVPIQFLRRSRCLDAWRELFDIFRGNLGNLVLYFLFRIVLAIVIGAIVVAAVLVTCCVAGCLFAIPYIGTVLLLPILVFERAYSLFYLRQYGPEYDVFNPPTQLAG